MDIEALTSQIEALTTRANEALEAAKAGDKPVEEVKASSTTRSSPRSTASRLSAPRLSAPLR
jgi:hypothetical protein